MISPYYFTHRNIPAGFETDLDSHHINHADSKIFFKPIYQKFGIETR